MKTGQVWRILIVGLLSIALAWWFLLHLQKSPEIVMTIGDSFAQIEQASSSKMRPAYSDGHWFVSVDKPASLRFNDPKYGFATPPAKFLTMVGDRDLATSVRMSPQVETLPLQETIAVVAGLERQLEKSGWERCKPSEYTAYKDDPKIAEKLLDGKSPGAYWRAGNKYMLNYDTGRFSGDPAQGDDRYLITISLGRGIDPPCLTPEEAEADRKRIEALPKNSPPLPTPVSDWLEGVK